MIDKRFAKDKFETRFRILSCESLENDLKQDYTTMLNFINEKLETIEQVHSDINVVIDSTIKQQVFFDRESQLIEQRCKY